ncbi:SCO0607 family lipoprotein [Streptomyces sp. NPDC018057]|uniref:SCO0607 family lipoprotein n=1 Tax=unclassified Streptomyces TaxID=2593676 RepID=UPI0037951C9F
MRHIRRAAALAAVAAAAFGTLTACSMQDAVCGGGEYPVAPVGSTGGACVPKDEEPPQGYVRYPEGKVPEKVGDTWDQYWETHVIDRDGTVRKAPADG